MEKQEYMKETNRAIRLKDTAKGDAKLTAMGYRAEIIAKMRKPDFGRAFRTRTRAHRDRSI